MSRSREILNAVDSGHAMILEQDYILHNGEIWLDLIRYKGKEYLVSSPDEKVFVAKRGYTVLELIR